MKKHLDLFIALVVIVAVGDAASLFGQGTVQQQQVGGLGFPPLGGGQPTGIATTLGGSRSRGQGPLSGVLGTHGAGLSGALGSISTARGSPMEGSGVGGPFDAVSASGIAGRPSVLNPSLSSGQFGPGVTLGSVAAGGPGSTQPLPSGPGSPFGSGTGPGPSLSGVPGGVSGQALSSSMGRGGLLSPRGTGETGVPGGALSIPNPSSAPRSPFHRGTGTGSSMSGLPGSISGQGLNTPLGSNGPFIPGGGEGSGAAGGLLSTPSLPTGPNASSGSGAAAVTSFPGLPGGVSEPGSPSLPNGGGPRTSGSNGPGGELSSASSIGAGPGAMRGIGRESGLAGPRLTGGNLSGRPGSQRRHRQRKLRPEEAAAVGLGVTSGALALGALAASIISAVNKRQHIKPVVPRRVGPGCLPTRCAGNCGRKRRSIAISKVPAEILDGIPVNFERPY